MGLIAHEEGACTVGAPAAAWRLIPREDSSHGAGALSAVSNHIAKWTSWTLSAVPSDVPTSSDVSPARPAAGSAAALALPREGSVLAHAPAVSDGGFLVRARQAMSSNGRFPAPPPRGRRTLNPARGPFRWPLGACSRPTACARVPIRGRPGAERPQTASLGGRFASAPAQMERQPASAWRSPGSPSRPVFLPPRAAEARPASRSSKGSASFIRQSVVIAASRAGRERVWRIPNQDRVCDGLIERRTRLFREQVAPPLGTESELPGGLIRLPAAAGRRRPLAPGARN